MEEHRRSRRLHRKEPKNEKDLLKNFFTWLVLIAMFVVILWFTIKAFVDKVGMTQ